jgi:hypothetical protein
MKSNILALRLLIALLVGVAGFAVESAQAGARDVKRLGLNLSVGGEPNPSDYGLNLNYNGSSWMRLTAGVGTGAGYTTLSGGFRLLIPNFDLSPFLGMSYSGTLNNGSSGGYGSFVGGLDLQTDFGFNLGCGVSQILNQSKLGPFFFYVGWYW